MIRTLFTILIIFIACLLHGQASTIISKKSKISLGEVQEIELTIKDVKPKDIAYVDWSLIGSFTCPINDQSNVDIDIELVDAGQFTGEGLVWKTENLNWRTNPENPNLLSNNFHIIFWEHYDCPLSGPKIILKDSSVIQGDILIPTQLDSPLSEAFLLQESTKGLGLGVPIVGVADTSLLVVAPILDIIRTEQNLLDRLKRIWWLFALAFIGLLAWYFNKRRKNTEIELTNTAPEPIIPKIPAHITALEQLNEMKKTHPWEQGNDKQFVSQLTNIIRNYMGERFDFHASEMTTNEITQETKTLLSEEQNKSLVNTLNVADLIKFAKAKADDQSYIRFVDEAIELVESTKKIEVDEGIE